MNQKELLTSKQLTLAPTLKEGPLDEGVIPLKNVPRKSYLTISPKQWQVLKRFREGKTVSEVLPDLILKRECPSLSSLYELVVKAHQAGILLDEDQELEDTGEASIKAYNWRLKLNENYISVLSWASILFGLAALFWAGITLPQTLLPILLVWCASSAALSLGNVLAASLLRWHEVDIYHPRFHWKTLIPHFCFDCSDIIMIPRSSRKAVALSRIAPLFLFLGLSAILWPPMAYGLLLGLFYASDPVTSNPATDYLRAYYKKLRLSTSEDFLFVQNRLFWTLLNNKVKLDNKFFYLVYALYTFAWLALVHLLHARLFDIQGPELLATISTSEHFPFAAGSVVIALLGMMLLAGGYAFWILLKNTETLWKSRRRRKVVKLDDDETPNNAKKAEIVGSTLLFRKAGLEPETLAAIAERASVLRFEKHDIVIREGDQGDSLFVVAQGEVSVQKETASGRDDEVARLGPLEAFGEIALLRRVPRTRSVVARKRTLLLEISRDDFQQHLVGQVGAEQIEATLKKEAFLARLEFTSSWSPHALRRFSELATECSIAAGKCFLKKGHDNRFFYLVYEGALEAREGKKRLSKLSIGDFFGEISLLQNSIITADVYALEDSRCFVLNKKDFLRFISEDFVISLYFEKVSSKRLKEPIFPLRGKSFDCTVVR
jgi:CRP-like cAMP-binding protein